MNNDPRDDVQRALEELEREVGHAEARLTLGIAHPEILSANERASLERIRHDDPESFVRMLSRLARSPLPELSHISRIRVFVHAVAALGIAGILLWAIGVQNYSAWLLSGLIAVHGFSKLLSAFLDSQEKLDRKQSASEWTQGNK